TSGSSCVRIGCQTGFSNPSTISSTTAATLGTHSLTNPGRLCPSRDATGQQSVTQSEDWYKLAATAVSQRPTFSGRAIASSNISPGLELTHVTQRGNPSANTEGVQSVGPVLALPSRLLHAHDSKVPRSSIDIELSDRGRDTPPWGRGIIRTVGEVVGTDGEVLIPLIVSLHDRRHRSARSRIGSLPPRGGRAPPASGRRRACAAARISPRS